MRVSRALSGLLLLAAVAAGGQDLALELVEVAGELTRPIAIAHAGDGSGRLFIVQQTGEILILSRGSVRPTPFLDISSLVACCGERGLLGLAFHPDYAGNGFFYVHYSEAEEGDTLVARYQVSAGDPNIADPGSAQIVLAQDQPNTNHNGGQLAFGPDGYLYIALGDGGGGGDPGENAQDLSSTWLGKILRIDVDGDDFPGDPDRNYSVPEDNPFVEVEGEDEIWAYGLRNPWRFSFDRLTGDLWIGDVGQQMWEEIDFRPAASGGGENYGWDVLEGGLQPGEPGPEHANCFEDEPGGDGTCADFLTGASVLPVLEYQHSLGRCSVTGGTRYRGIAQPRLWGIYFFADFCTGEIWGALPDCTGGFVSRMLLDAPRNITAFGEDEDGELYVTQFSFTAGQSTVQRITVDPAPGGPELTPDPVQLAFANSTVGSAETMAVTLENTGSGQHNLVIEFATLTDDFNFDLDVTAGAAPCGGAPVCLPPGDDCTLEVTFEPQREGGFDEFLLLPANSTSTVVSLQAVVPCTGPDQLPVTGTVSVRQVHTACQTITAGPNLTVAGSGDLDLRAGGSIGVQAPFVVENGAVLRLVVDPALAAN